MNEEALPQNQTEENQQTSEKTLQNQNSSTDANCTSPPDGRVYLTEDEPHPYLPTQTPKGWNNFPILPPKKES